MTVSSASGEVGFSLSQRHRRMFLDGLDMIGATLAQDAEIRAFEQRHWGARPWLKNVAYATRDRLDRSTPQAI
jgi:3-isopropylmalate/(R)-2-methylmalate dehydratase small subunit